MTAYDVIVSKREIRTYTDRPLSEETLLQILNAGRMSGSSRNRQPWHFVVVRDRSRLRDLAAYGRFAGHLPGAAAVVCVVVDGPAAMFDAGRCAQNLMLGAWALGVASCPASLHGEKEAKRFLDVPGDRVIATAIALGYPHPRGRGTVERTALRILAGRGRRPLVSMVSWERFGGRSG
ncbi:MAG TPA: nitroreductase family protein [bacterium]